MEKADLRRRAEVRVSIAELRITLAASELPIGVSETAQCSQRRKPPGTQALFLVPHGSKITVLLSTAIVRTLNSHICLDT
jgi:hypothetical protein